MANSVNLIDSWWAIILPTVVLSFGIFMMRLYITKAVPTALLEAAQIDGAGQFFIFHRIVVPLSVNMISALSIYVFIGAWKRLPVAVPCSQYPKEIPAFGSAFYAERTEQHKLRRTVRSYSTYNCADTHRLLDLPETIHRRYIDDRYQMMQLDLRKTPFSTYSSFLAISQGILKDTTPNHTLYLRDLSSGDEDTWVSVRTKHNQRTGRTGSLLLHL